jgi:hypothetical protein
MRTAHGEQRTAKRDREIRPGNVFLKAAEGRFVKFAPADFTANFA